MVRLPLHRLAVEGLHLPARSPIGVDSTGTGEQARQWHLAYRRQWSGGFASDHRSTCTQRDGRRPLALTLAVTHFWKVSFHAAVAAGTATILVLLFGAAWSLAWLVVAAIAWSRVYLRSHTPAQVVVGITLGALAAGPVYPPLA